MGRLIFYIVATSYLRRGRRDVKLRDQDVLRKLFAEWDCCAEDIERSVESICRAQTTVSKNHRNVLIGMEE